MSSPSGCVKQFSLHSMAFAAVMWLGTPGVDIIKRYSWLSVPCSIFCRRLLVSWLLVGVFGAFLVRLQQSCG